MYGNETDCARRKTSETQIAQRLCPRRRARIIEGNGLRCCITSWQRTSDNAIPIRLKCGANYQNGRLATLQAKADGYDAPIFLNQHGTGQCGCLTRVASAVTKPGGSISTGCKPRAIVRASVTPSLISSAIFSMCSTSMTR